MPEQKRSGPLSGMRVLELGTMIAGPVAATLLADFGAEVIKIEQPGAGDPLRKIGPFAGGESLYWNVEGRNKKSVTLDLHHPDGQQAVRDLARHADLLVENFRPGTMAKWNLGYEQLRAVNPRLVMLSISGFGQTGPNAQKPSYDRIALAFAGFLNTTGYADRPPVRPGFAVADYQSALFGAFSAMVALHHRDASGGTGQHIDVSLYETIFRFTDVMVTAYDKLGTTRERRGNDHFAAAPGGHFPTQSGRYIALTVSANTMFARVCKAIGQPALLEDARFASHAARSEHLGQINGIVAAWILATPDEEVRGSFEREGVAFAFIYNVEDIVNDPQYLARESFVSVDHPRLGPLKMQNVMPRMSATPSSPIQVAPELGADTDAVLRDLLGMTSADIAGLRARGVC